MSNDKTSQESQSLLWEHQGDNSSSTYDPLMAASFAIWDNALEAFGIEIMYADALCPLCLMDNHKKTCTEPGCEAQSGDDWIQFAADGQLEVARKMRLVPKAS
jgi:hypothetical protein